MERLLARLERRLGRYAIPNLIGVIVGGMAVVWVLSMLKPEFQSALTLDFRMVARGQVWRLVTFLFIPPPSSPLWIAINLYFTWWVGSTLEQNWGAFKFNVYYAIGAIATVVAALFAGGATNFWLDASLFLAFATVFPNIQILLFFILPIRVKWLGLVAAAGMAFSAFTGGLDARASIAAALVNYLLFFTGHWLGYFRERKLLATQKGRREALRAGPSVRPAQSVRPGQSVRPREESAAPAGNANVFGQRTCAICGAREADGADIRVCSCEKCGGQQRTLCLEHARNH